MICILVFLGVGALVWRSTKNMTYGLLTSAVLILPTAVTYIVKADLFQGLVQSALGSLDLFSRYNALTYGYFDIPTIVFYISFIGFFLFLTVRSMEKRRLA